jgi:hypothetical protein
MMLVDALSDVPLRKSMLSCSGIGEMASSAEVGSSAELGSGADAGNAPPTGRVPDMSSDGGRRWDLPVVWTGRRRFCPAACQRPMNRMVSVALIAMRVATSGFREVTIQWMTAASASTAATLDASRVRRIRAVLVGERATAVDESRRHSARLCVASGDGTKMGLL